MMVSRLDTVLWSCCSKLPFCWSDDLRLFSVSLRLFFTSSSSFWRLRLAASSSDVCFESSSTKQMVHLMVLRLQEFIVYQFMELNYSWLISTKCYFCQEKKLSQSYLQKQYFSNNTVLSVLHWGYIYGQTLAWHYIINILPKNQISDIHVLSAVFHQLSGYKVYCSYKGA